MSARVTTMPFVSLNPTTDQVIPLHAGRDVNRLESALKKAHSTQQT